MYLPDQHLGSGVSHRARMLRVGNLSQSVSEKSHPTDGKVSEKSHVIVVTQSPLFVTCAHLYISYFPALILRSTNAAKISKTHIYSHLYAPFR